MSLLEQHLGRVLTASEVSEYLRCDISSVYRHYQKLGGIRIGASYKFFERNLVDYLKAPHIVKDAPSKRPVPAQDAPIRGASQRRERKLPFDQHGLL